VGGIREQFLSGDPCDILILTSAQIEEQMASGRVVPGTAADLGAAPTSVAVRAGDAMPDVSTPDALRAALLAADAIYLPDPQKATAGIHFAKVLSALGIADTVAARVKAFPNGATAMREMARAGGHPIGCTQATEIVATPGAALVATALPPQFRLATVYTAALSAAAEDPAYAQRFIDALAGGSMRAARARAGFEGSALRPARGEDTAAVQGVVFGVLAEYGLKPDPAGTDADIMDIGAHYLARGGAFDVVIGPDGAIVGSCGIDPEESGACELRKMYLRRDARGHGLGRRLLARAIAFARGRGFRRIELETASVLTEAIALYERSGFRPLPGRSRVARCDRAFVLEL
jgi:molybdate transport system substrate-binding protein